ncbi:hypothetical protein IAU60_005462 [Kwoniella sp. DSM 27419]
MAESQAVHAVSAVHSSPSSTTLRPSPSPHPRVRVRGSAGSHVSPAASTSAVSDDAGRSRSRVARDYRERLPPIVARFLGIRPPGAVPPYDPLPYPPFCWLVHIDLKYEVWIFAFIGSIVSIFLVEAILCTHTAFREVYHSPVMVTSFGAAAVLLFGVIESPLAQPRNHVSGNFTGALIGVALTRLFILRTGGYEGYLENEQVHGSIFVNGGLAVSVTLLATLMLGVVHPPAGATALAAATEPHVVPMSWHYIPIVLSASLLIITWALIINNLGRRRYPQYWWTPHEASAATPPSRENNEETALKTLEEGYLRRAEDGGRTGEGLLMERMQGEGGRELMRDVDMRTASSCRGLEQPLTKTMSAGDRRRSRGG